MVDIKNIEVYKSIINYLEVVKKVYRIQHVYLFGSYANGHASIESDIDLAIVSQSFGTNKFDENVTLGKLTWGIDTRIEPIGFSPEEFQSDFFAQEIKRTGIEIQIS